MPTGDLSIQAERHPSGFWITITVWVGQHYRVAFVVDSGSPASVISPEVRSGLAAAGLLIAGGSPGAYRLTDAWVQGQQMPEFDVRVLPRLDRIHVDGLLGLDFLTKFETMIFHVPTLTLTLELGTPP